MMNKVVVVVVEINRVLKSYLIKLRRRGPLTGKKHPKIEWWAKWILALMAKNLSGNKWSDKWALVRCCILPICLQQLHYQNYPSVSRERRTFLSNRCKIEIHYPFQISRRQVSFIASPLHDMEITTTRKDRLPEIFKIHAQFLICPFDHLFQAQLVSWKRKEKFDRHEVHYSWRIFIKRSSLWVQFPRKIIHNRRMPVPVYR